MQIVALIGRPRLKLHAADTVSSGYSLFGELDIDKKAC